MNIPEEAVKAAQEATEGGFGITDDYMIAALTAAMPFLQGVKVKALEWEDGEYNSKFNSEFIGYEIQACDDDTGKHYAMRVNHYGSTYARRDTLEAAKAAAQADYEARILSAIEVSPSLRAQTLEALKRTPAIEALTPTTDEWLRCETIQDTYDLMKRRVDRVIHALSSQPVADGWKERVAFNRGYVIACANIVNLHGADVPVAEGFAQLSMSREELKSLDLCEYDQSAINALEEFWGVEKLYSATLPASPGASATRPTGGSNHGE